MNMKKVIFTMLLLCTIGSMQSFAQENPKGKSEHFNWQKTYQDEAGISPEVQEKIETIKQESDVKAKAIRKDKTLADDARKEKLKANNKEKSDAINALLTKEQKVKIKAIKERLKGDKEG